MDHKLSSHPRTCSEHGPVTCDIESSLHGRVQLAHVRHGLPAGLLAAQTGATPDGHLRTRVGSEVDREHGYHGLKGSPEDVLPLSCGQILAMVGAGFRFRRPFLLEEGFAVEFGKCLAGEVVEIPLTPGLADTLVVVVGVLAVGV